jgi:hypothetical protein
MPSVPSLPDYSPHKTGCLPNARSEDHALDFIS